MSPQPAAAHPNASHPIGAAARPYRAYGTGAALRKGTAALLLAVGASLFCAPAPASARTVRLVALGDSLSAGFRLPADAAFPAVLEQALRAEGLDVAVGNAGVSGDTAQDGLNRLDWSVPDGTDAVIVELGANDMLRGQNPDATRKTLDDIITRLRARGIKVLLAGMYAIPSLGKDYADRFQAIYPALAQKYGVPLYPFFLQGIARDPALNLDDGLHPNRAGVGVIVRSILPAAAALVRSVEAKG